MTCTCGGDLQFDSCVEGRMWYQCNQCFEYDFDYFDCVAGG